MSTEIRTGWVLFWVALALAFAMIDVVYGAETDQLSTDRYALERTDDGFVRMDRQTGEMSVCREQAGSLVCRKAADDRVVGDTELQRLRRENAELRQQIAAVSRALGVEPPALTKPETSNRVTDGLPTDEELDQVMDVFEGVMERFFGMVERLRDDIEAPKAPNET